jgi:hypothetical protein
MNRLALLLPILSLAACVSADDTDASDNAAETAPVTASGGKADDALGIVGTAYEMTSPTTYKAGDITNLELTDTSYVRGRCYHTGCSTWAPETNHWDSFTSGTHHYLRFYSFTKDGSGNETQVIADAYEVKKLSTGIKLRKTYTSRWITLAARTSQVLCGESGGTWSNATCDCGPMQGPDWVLPIDGLGGCFQAPTGTEASCDATGGDYTDDDTTAIGTFCLCPIGTMVTETGCQTI